MSHRKHIVPCVIAMLVAITLLATVGATPLVAGVGLAFLLCPIVMGTVMWLLMRQPKAEHPQPYAQEVHEHVSTARRP